MTPASMLRKDKRTAQAAPLFQHRHFAFIAKVLAGLPAEYPREQLAKRFAWELGSTNPNFDPDRFMAAYRAQLPSAGQ